MTQTKLTAVTHSQRSQSRNWAVVNWCLARRKATTTGKWSWSIVIDIAQSARGIWAT